MFLSKAEHVLGHGDGLQHEVLGSSGEEEAVVMAARVVSPVGSFLNLLLDLQPPRVLPSQEVRPAARELHRWPHREGLAVLEAGRAGVLRALQGSDGRSLHPPLQVGLGCPSLGGVRLRS